MSDELDIAFIRAWDAADLDTVVTGGLVDGPRAYGTSYPYARLTQLANVIAGRSGGRNEGSNYFERTLQLDIWDRSKAEVGSHMRKIVSALADTPAVRNYGFGQGIEVQSFLLDNELLVPEDEDLYHGVLEFIAKVRRLRRT